MPNYRKHPATPGQLMHFIDQVAEAERTEAKLEATHEQERRAANNKVRIARAQLRAALRLDPCDCDECRGLVPAEKEG